MKKYINAALSLASVGLLFYVIHNQNYQIKTLKVQSIRVDSLNKVVDSLNSELFIKHFETDRYEIAIDMLKEQDPKAADEFEKCLHNVE